MTNFIFSYLPISHAQVIFFSSERDWSTFFDNVHRGAVPQPLMINCFNNRLGRPSYTNSHTVVLGHSREKAEILPRVAGSLSENGENRYNF